MQWIARATGNGNFTSLARDSSQLREARDCNLWNATSSQHEHDVMAIGYPAFHTEAIMHEGMRYVSQIAFRPSRSGEFSTKSAGPMNRVRP
jgi:hypothetical protein